MAAMESKFTGVTRFLAAEHLLRENSTTAVEVSAAP